MEQPGDIVRPAGLLERYHISRFSLGLDSCVIMTAQYTPPEGCFLDETTVYDALTRVVEAHAALSIRLGQDPTQDPTFERLQKVDLSQVVEFADACSLEAALEAQLLRKFDTTSNLPLWRVVVFGDGTICFAWHHGFGDGKSGLAFHRALFASLQEGKVRGGDPVVIPSKDLMVPPLEMATDVSPSWRKFAVEVFGLLAPVSWTHKAGSWTGNPVPLNITLQNHVRLIDFSPDVVSTLLVLSRSHKATITSVFHELAISVISGLLSSEKYRTISSGVPISLRDLSGTSNDAMCNYVSALMSCTALNFEFSWVRAAQFAVDLRAYVRTSPEEIGMLKYLNGKYDAFFRGKLGKKRGAGIEISNVGRFEVKRGSSDEQTWSIGRMVFAQCDVVQGAALKLSVVGDALGGITMSVIWGAGSVSDGFAEGFIANFRSGIEKLLKEGS
ncbi:hypothetical protein DXG01_000930 [Tephrocybe rancida]|nr:hypothetical protein DXG01_000930 [Tephrocybe rancida]